AQGRRGRRDRHEPRLDRGGARGVRGPGPGADRRPRAGLRCGRAPARRLLAGRHRARAAEHGRRGHLRRLVRARSEPALAPAARAAGAQDRREPALAHRRLDASGPGARLRLVVTADDYDDAVAFYRDVLGMPELAVWSSPDGGRVMLLDAGRATLELT